MSRRLIVALSCYVLFGIQEVEATTVFSFNGFGYLVRPVDGRSTGMGGAGRAVVDGFNLSTTNPALLGAVRRSSLSTSYFVQRRNLSGDEATEEALADGDIGGLRLALPFRPGSVFGVSLTPVTDVDAAFVDSAGVGETRHQVTFRGGGGGQALTIGLAHRAGSLHVGAALDLLVLGTMSEIWRKDFNSGISPSEDRIIRSQRGLQPHFGVIYQTGRFSIGVDVRTPATVTQRLRQRNIFAQRNFLSTEIDTKRDVKLPFTIGGGVAMAHRDKVIVALDAEKGRWASTGAGRRDSLDLALGLLYRTGEADPIRWARRVELTAGGYLRDLYLETNGPDGIRELGASFGLGLPFGGQTGMFRWAIELGRRGNESSHGVSERFIRQTFTIVGWMN